MSKDNRPYKWHISLHDFERDAVIERWKQSGLSKAAFGRQALMNAQVVARTDPESLRILRDLSHARADIDRLVHICEKQGALGERMRMIIIEDLFSKLYNELKSRII